MMNIRTILSKFGKIPHAAKIEFLAFLDIVRFGLPGVMLQFGGGIGDELLLTTVAHELKLRNPKLRIWQVSHSVVLLLDNPDYCRVLGMDHWPLRHAMFLESSRLRLAYAQEIIPKSSELPPDIHILAELCRKAGMHGDVSLRPYYFFSPGELAQGRKAKAQIAIQCCDAGTYSTVMLNKLWPKKRFQRVIEGIRNFRDVNVEVIQIGSAQDPLLENVIDLRGKTTVRETAAILANSLCFVGTVGFLMHLARAVECRSVIVYGGREHSCQTGYICNENLDSFVECSPCWLWNDCDFERRCMTMISPEDVLAAVQRVLSRQGTTLETEVAVL